MPFTRRQLFASLAGMVPVLKLTGSANQLSEDGADSASIPVDAHFIRSLVDALVPEDGTPGAVDAGLDRWLEERAANVPEIMLMIGRIAGVCNAAAIRQGARRFADLDLDDREQILTDLLYSDEPDTIAWIQNARGPLFLIRYRVFAEFYLRPEGHISAGYSPPWPDGYRGT